MEVQLLCWQGVRKMLYESVERLDLSLPLTEAVGQALTRRLYPQLQARHGWCRAIGVREPLADSKRRRAYKENCLAILLLAISELDRQAFRFWSPADEEVVSSIKKRWNRTHEYGPSMQVDLLKLLDSKSEKPMLVDFVAHDYIGRVELRLTRNVLEAAYAKMESKWQEVLIYLVLHSFESQILSFASQLGYKFERLPIDTNLPAEEG